MRSRRRNLSRERLQELLHYDPTTGIFRWLVDRSPKTKAGDIAGASGVRGCIVITVDYVQHFAHQLAWLYMTGEWADIIDHRDTRPVNNVFDNLRKATQSQNRANSRSRRDRKRDLPKGVVLDGKKRPYRAQIYVGGKREIIGYFDNVEAAAAAYLARARDLFGEFARAA